MFNASMSFALGDEFEALRDMVHRWAQEKLALRVAEIDEGQTGAPLLLDRIAALECRPYALT